MVEGILSHKLSDRSMGGALMSSGAENLLFPKPISTRDHSTCRLAVYSLST